MTEKPNSIWAIEIFGGADLGVIPLHNEPMLAIDDPLWEFRPSTGAGAALCQKLENNDLLFKIAGCDEALKIVTPSISSTGVMSDLLNRAIFAHKTTPLRKKAVKSMVDAFRSCAAFKPIRDNDRFDSL